MTEQVFSGIRVVEFAQGMAGPMAAMMLADNGAEVLKVEPPSGDSARKSPGFLMWNRGKRSTVLDLELAEGREQAVALALHADVLVDSFGPGEAHRYGLSHESLAKTRPDLISCSIGGFGLASRFENLRARDEVVLAKTGRLNGNDLLSGAHYSGRPIYIASPFSSFAAAGLAVQGICAALLVRNRTGRGQHVSTSLVDGVITATMRLAYERKGDRAVPSFNRVDQSAIVTRGILLCFMTAECKDGAFIQMCARQDLHFRNWLKCMELADLLDDSRFRGAPIGLKTMEAAEELERLIRARMKTKTVDEWMDLFIEGEVGADPFLTPAQFLRHPQMVANDRIVSLKDPRRGTVTQVGKLAHFSATPSRITRSAPELGADEHGVATWLAAKRPPNPTPPVTPSVRHDKPPLQGFTIIELATFVAGPVGSALLAELGARVIKVEPIEGDSVRRVGLEVVHFIRGKESIALNLKTAEGQGVLHRLVRHADALIHNSRTGAVERIGADYATLSAVNPGLVFVAASGYGSLGPQAFRPAFHSTPHALCGGGILQAGRGNPPIDDSYPDPCAGVGAAVALAMGLLARDRTGRGQSIETTMLTCAGYVHSGRLTHYRDMPEPAMLDSLQLGCHAMQRLYRCSEGWILLSAECEDEWRALAFSLERIEWLNDSRFSVATTRLQNDTALSQMLEQVFATRPASAWEALLVNAGIGVAAVSSSLEEFAAAHGLVEPAEHRAFGSYFAFRPRVRFSASSPPSGVPCTVGEHTVAILSELGFTGDEIVGLRQRGIVASTAEASGKRASSASIQA